MMRPSAEAQVYLCRQPVDFRKGVAGLSVLVEQALGLDPFAQALFVFANVQCNKIKILYWDRNGFFLWYRRLEKERFKWPHHLEDDTVALSGSELNWLLDGFDVWRHPPHKILKFQSVS